MMKTKTPTIEMPGKTKQQRPGGSAASEAAAEPEVVGSLAEVRPKLSTNGHGKAKRIAVIPGDGIGKEVIPEAVRGLKAAAAAGWREGKRVEFDWGADRYRRDGVTLPADAVEMFHRDFDAILLGAMGDPRVQTNVHAADILLGLRFKLDLYVNARLCVMFDKKFTPLKDRTEKDVQFMVFRENTEGLYVGMGGNFKKGTTRSEERRV